MGKDGTQLLRHCVRLLVLVSTDLLAVRLSGIVSVLHAMQLEHICSLNMKCFSYSRCLMGLWKISDTRSLE